MFRDPVKYIFIAMMLKAAVLIFLIFNVDADPAKPCAAAVPFADVFEFDRIATGQLISHHDCDHDDIQDYETTWTVQEFAEFPIACQDPYDPRHLIVPVAGFYRVLAEPVETEISHFERGVYPSFYQPVNGQ